MKDTANMAKGTSDRLAQLAQQSSRDYYYRDMYEYEAV